MKKRLLHLTLALLGPATAAVACEVCAAQQPKILRGITHGTGPEGRFDYIIVLLAVALVIYTLGASIKCLVRSGEGASGHIKHSILNQD
jgi:hypothetical protein